MASIFILRASKAKRSKLSSFYQRSNLFSRLFALLHHSQSFYKVSILFYLVFQISQPRFVSPSLLLDLNYEVNMIMQQVEMGLLGIILVLGAIFVCIDPFMTLLIYDCGTIMNLVSFTLIFGQKAMSFIWWLCIMQHRTWQLCIMQHRSSHNLDVNSHMMLNYMLITSYHPMSTMTMLSPIC